MNPPSLHEASVPHRAAPSVRQKITRACDRCYSHRARCDGRQPCARCLAIGRGCLYARPVKQRGRKPRSERIQESEGRVTAPLGCDQASIGEASTSNQSHVTASASCLELSPLPSVNHCPYRCLEPLVPQLQGIITLDTACRLMDNFFDGAGLFLATASPYVLTPVLRRQSVQSQRRTSPGLLWTILWVCSLTASLPALMMPRQRKHVCAKLEKIALEYVSQSDCDQVDPASQEVDDLLACLLVALAISGGDAKRDMLPWYHKAVRLAIVMNLHQLDQRNGEDMNMCQCVPGSRRHALRVPQSTCPLESREEKRRAFWLLFALDRHWALSYNSLPLILDHECKLYDPLPDEVWTLADLSCQTLANSRSYGPRISVTGNDFFGFFLPLMIVLGDIIWVHHQQCHPRLHRSISNDTIAHIEALLAQSLGQIKGLTPMQVASPSLAADAVLDMSFLGQSEASDSNAPTQQDLSVNGEAQAVGAYVQQCVQLYALFILQVLHVLLHGRWDALDLLSRDYETDTMFDPSVSLNNPVRISLSDWITSLHFTKCTSHAIAASETLSQILYIDPELAFMPYLFGIYLLHASFILLFFADRLPEVGQQPDGSVEKACEIIIRAHEVSFATLTVEFQRDFRRILRKTLSKVQKYRWHHARPGEDDMGQAIRVHSPSIGRMTPHLGSSERPDVWKELLQLYRWSPGSRGLAI